MPVVLNVESFLEMKLGVPLDGDLNRLGRLFYNQIDAADDIKVDDYNTEGENNDMRARFSRAKEILAKIEARSAVLIEELTKSRPKVQ